MASLKRMKIFALVGAVFALQACGLTLPKDEAARTTPSQNLGQRTIEGRFTSLDGGTIDLSAESGRIQVLMFVSETCSVCREETQTLVSDRAARGVPVNAAFYSVVVGSVAEDADDWRRDLGVNWTVGLDSGDALFRSYCPGLQTPCTLLRNPVEGTLSALTGRHSIADWERLTGPWTF